MIALRHRVGVMAGPQKLIASWALNNSEWGPRRGTLASIKLGDIEMHWHCLILLKSLNIKRSWTDISPSMPGNMSSTKLNLQQQQHGLAHWTPCVSDILQLPLWCARLTAPGVSGPHGEDVLPVAGWDRLGRTRASLKTLGWCGSAIWWAWASWKGQEKLGSSLDSVLCCV